MNRALTIIVLASLGGIVSTAPSQAASILPKVAGEESFDASERHQPTAGGVLAHHAQKLAVEVRVQPL